MVSQEEAELEEIHAPEEALACNGREGRAEGNLDQDHIKPFSVQAQLPAESAELMIGLNVKHFTRSIDRAWSESKSTLMMSFPYCSVVHVHCYYGKRDIMALLS